MTTRIGTFQWTPFTRSLSFRSHIHLSIPWTRIERHGQFWINNDAHWVFSLKSLMEIRTERSWPSFVFQSFWNMFKWNRFYSGCRCFNESLWGLPACCFGIYSRLLAMANHGKKARSVPDLKLTSLHRSMPIIIATFDNASVMMLSRVKLCA